MQKKSLPSVSSPTLSIVLPISGIKVKYRPFVIREQKALLLAQQSNDMETVNDTLKSVIDTCTNGTLDFSKIPTADLAYFFIQLRICSVGADVRFNLKCTECKTDNLIELNLEGIKIDNPKIDPIIKLTDKVGIKFRLPTVEDTIKLDKFQGADKAIAMLYNIIEHIYDEDSVYTKQDYSEEDFKTWIEDLNDIQIKKIESFVKDIPDISHRIDYTCSKCNHKNSRLVEGLHNFFRFIDNP